MMYRLTQIQVVLERWLERVEEVLAFVATEWRLEVVGVRNLPSSRNVAAADVLCEIGCARAELVELGGGLDDDTVRNPIEVGQRLSVGSCPPVVFVPLHLELISGREADKPDRSRQGSGRATPRRDPRRLSSRRSRWYHRRWTSRRSASSRRPRWGG